MPVNTDSELFRHSRGTVSVTTFTVLPTSSTSVGILHRIESATSIDRFTLLLFFPGNSYPGRMEPGNTFTIEPAISQGTHECIILEDGWTAITADGSRSAQFEHTVLITDNGVEVLTWTFFFVGTSTERIFCYCKSPRRRMDDSHETRWCTKVAKVLAIT